MPSNLQKFLESFSDGGESKEGRVPGEKGPAAPETLMDGTSTAVIEDGPDDNRLQKNVEKPQKVEVQSEVEDIPERQTAVETQKRTLRLNKTPQAVQRQEPEYESVQSPQQSTPEPLKQSVESEEEALRKEIDYLFVHSETDERFRETWVDTLLRARKANVKTQFNKKVSEGRFRFDDSGQLEILPDIDTYGMSSKEILSMRWDQNKE